MVLSSQRTVYGMALQLSQLLNLEYTPLTNTTLNEKFDISPGYELEDNIYPKLRYFAIGIGGNPMLDNGVGYKYSQHSPVDAALFQHIPFIMRPVTSDLDDVERLQYRFRKVEIFDEIEYACYYLKVIQTIELRDYFYRITTKDGASALLIFNTNTDKLLNPVPKSRTIENVSINDYEYVTKMSKLRFELTIPELSDLKEAMVIRGVGDKQITEIGVCTGSDVLIDGKMESVVTQVAFHVDVNIDLSVAINSDMSILRSIEIGGTEACLI